MAIRTWTHRSSTDLSRSRDRRMQLNICARLRFTWIILSALSLGMALSSGDRAVAQTKPDFGPNVYILDPSMSSATIESTLSSLSGVGQFDTTRYAVLFKPGTYNIQGQVGYYESIAGLGETPDAVIINGFLPANEDTALGTGNATQTFWRSMENMTFNPNPDTWQGAPWGVSQGAALRRLQINGSLGLATPTCGYASGGFLADSRITGNVNICGQQWFTRNSVIGSWTGTGFNMVFSGVEGAPLSDYLNNAFVVLPTSPISREKPFLYVDKRGAYRVFVPAARKSSSGVSWSERSGQGYSLSIDAFFIAQPSTSLADINRALAFGKHLILTPGVYQYSGAIKIAHPNTIVLGLGYATLVPQDGTAAIEVADVDGVQIAGLLIDAGPVNSPVLLQLGHPNRSRVSHAQNPTSLNDVFFRIGGATPGTATTTLEVDSNDVILDNIWAWRADHGNGVGWTDNVADHGLVVNGNNVTALGLAVEHYEKNQVVWNGEGGTTIFYQSEIPYDVPSQIAWMNGSANGYSSYSVSAPVKTHAAYGFGVYSFFDQGINIVEDSAITVPDTAGVSVTDAMTWFITGSGAITHVVNDAGNAVSGGGQTARLLLYPDVPCDLNCPIAPNSPLGLTAEVVSPNQVDLNWSAHSLPGVRYSVFRSLDPSFTPSADNQLYSGLTGTSYADENVNPTATYYYSVEAVSDSGTSEPSNIASATIPSSGGPIGQDILDINAGGGAAGAWLADEDYSGGTATSTGTVINTTLIPNPAPQSVYQSNRYGAFSYNIPGLTAGWKYIVDLHFAETYWTSPGQRQFNVLINGKQVLKNFDIVAAAGGQNIATAQSFLVSADSSGTIAIQFVVGAADNPQVNGIEIGTPCETNCPVVPNAPTKLTTSVISPNQINLAWIASSTPGVKYAVFRGQEPGFRPTAANEVASGLTGTSYSDSDANPSTIYYYAVEALNGGGTSPASNYATATTPTSGGAIASDLLDINAGGEAVGGWVTDEDFAGGTATTTGTTINTSLVANSAPQSVYQSNRYGSFTYTIPGFTAGGQYIVDLHFAETYWTGPGKRQFNVLINGKQVLKNYDIFASAGGAYIATVESFLVTADNTGTITIQVAPGAADNPQVNGIEIGVGSVAPSLRKQ
jgi:Malectin domain